MTLIVSLRTPDGVVLAGDSLSTMLGPVEFRGKVSVTCPKCGLQHEIDHQAATAVPTATFSYAQKVFDFMGSYAVGTFGAAQLGGNTIHFSGRQLEQELNTEGWQPKSTREIAERIGGRLQELLAKQLPNLSEAQDNWFPVGIKVAGYDGTAPQCVRADVGKAVKITEYNGLGCSIAGRGDVVAAIWKLYEEHPQDQAQYDSFSLQDAIDYADFLIRTTSSYQRFSRSMPSVGGDIDVALVTPFEKFRWIRQKPLAKVLGGGFHEERLH